MYLKWLEQKKFVDIYLKSKTMTECCNTLNISRATGYNYLNDEIVQLEIQKRRSELISDTTKYLQNQLTNCSKILIDIANNETNSPQIRINAINSVFNNCNKLTETNDILQKINDIEDKIKEMSDNE